MRVVFVAAVCSVLLAQCFGKNVFAKSPKGTGAEVDPPPPPPDKQDRSGCDGDCSRCGSRSDSGSDDCHGSGNDGDCDRSGSGDDYSLRQLIRDECGPPPPPPPPGQKPPPLTREAVIDATTQASETIMSIGTTLLTYRPEIEMALHEAQTDDMAQLVSHRNLFEGFQGLMEGIGEDICTIVPLHKVAERILNRSLPMIDIEPAMIVGFPDGGCARAQILLEECGTQYEDMSLDQIADELKSNITIVQILAQAILRDLRCLLDDTAGFQNDLEDLVAEISAPGATLNHVRARILALDTTVQFFINQGIDMYFALESVSGAIMLLNGPVERRERLAEKVVSLLQVLSES